MTRQRVGKISPPVGKKDWSGEAKKAGSWLWSNKGNFILGALVLVVLLKTSWPQATGPRAAQAINPPSSSGEMLKAGLTESPVPTPTVTPTVFPTETPTPEATILVAAKPTTTKVPGGATTVRKVSFPGKINGPGYLEWWDGASRCGIFRLAAGESYQYDGLGSGWELTTEAEVDRLYPAHRAAFLVSHTDKDGRCRCPEGRP